MARAYERLWDMPMDRRAARAQGVRGVPLWFAHLVAAIIGAVFRVCFRYRVDGVENLRAFEGRRGAVVIGNHVSYLDVVFMFLAARPRQWIRFVARESLFEAGHGAFGWAISRVGAVPIKRDSADTAAIKRAVRIVKGGELLGIMPEGTRRGKGSQVPQVHAGVALIARMAKAPIVPMATRNVGDIKRKGERLRFPKVSIEFGDPVLVSDFDFLPKEDRLEACAWFAMRRVFAMSQGVPEDQVDMRALFPEGRDFSEAFRGCDMPRHTAEELACGFDVWGEGDGK